jgi:hypothetical protein
MLVQSSAVSDQPPYVLIAANPYEEKLVRRALELTGLRIEGADGVEGLRARVAAERPLVVVAAEGWMAAELDEVLAAVAAMGDGAPPLFVVADLTSGRESAGRVRVFVRPIDAEEIADAIEKLAVEAEQARDGEVISSDAIAEVIEDDAPPSLELEADSDEDWRARPPSRPRLARIALARVAVPKPNGSAKATPVSELPRAQATPVERTPPPPTPPPPTAPAPTASAAPTSSTVPGLARLDELDDPFELDGRVSPPRVSPTQVLPPERGATADVPPPPPAPSPPPARPASVGDDAPAAADGRTPLRASPTVRIGPARVELLRADDAMADVTGLGAGGARDDAPGSVRLTDVELPARLEVSPAPPPAPPPPRELAARAAEPPRPPQRFADRSTFARRLDDQLSEVERRLFPDAATSSMRRYEDYDDALDDIDLDNLGVDTLPGLSAERLEVALSSPPRQPTAKPPTPPTSSTSNGLDDRPPPAFDPAPTPRLQTFDPAPTPRSPLRDIPTALEGPADASPLDRLAAARARATTSPSIAAAPSAPTIDQPIARPLPDEGSFATTDVCALLLELHAAGFCGRLVATRGDGEKQLDFDGGTPVAARSSFAHDRLGDLLFREGKLTREQHARTRELSVEPGRKTAQLFVELGLLKANEIFPALRRQAEEILHSLFAWTQGSFRLVAAEVPADERLRLSAHPWALYLEGVRRKYGLERLAELVAADAVLHPTTTLEQVFGDAALTPPERRVAEAIDGQRTLGELVRIGAAGARPSGLGEPPRAGDVLDEAGVYGLAWFLLSVGAARTDAAAEAEADGSARPGVRAVSTVVEPIEAIGDQGVERRRVRRERADSPADRAVDRERVRAKRAQLDDADYFSVLGLERDATPHEIARAYDRLIAEFAPARFAPELAGELAADLRLIAETLDEARRVLGDDEVRGAYRASLAG